MFIFNYVLFNICYVLTRLLFLIAGDKTKMVGGGIQQKCASIFRRMVSSDIPEGSVVSRGARGRGRGKGGPRRRRMQEEEQQH